MKLFVVSTPIGNLEDITFRAVRILREVDFICAEDTRTSRVLLSHYAIRKPLFSLHAYSSPQKVQTILGKILHGNSAALISDAGTPGISDPGWSLIRACIDAKVNVIPIPGPSSLLASLVGSGFPMHRFQFFGFLPLKKGRKKLLQTFRDQPGTIVFFESPHRITRTLFDLTEVLSSSVKIVIARELTKIHEEFIRGSLGEIQQKLSLGKPLKGELTVLLLPTS